MKIDGNEPASLSDTFVTFQEDAILLIPSKSRIWRALGVLILFAVVLALLALDGEHRAQVLIGLVFVLAAVFKLFRTVREVVWKSPAVRIVDSDTRTATTGEAEGIVWIPRLSVRAVCVRFRFRRNPTLRGHFDVRLDREGERALWPSWTADAAHWDKLISLAEDLSARWRVPLRVRTRDVRAARIVARHSVNVVPLILAIALIGAAIVMAIKEYRVTFWRETQAVVRAFDPQLHEGSGGWYANPSVEYEFVLGGVRHFGNGWSPSGFGYVREGQFQRDSKGIVAGARVPCWYNPGDPNQSYIINQGVCVGTICTGILGALLLAISAHAYVWRRGLMGSLDRLAKHAVP